MGKLTAPQMEPALLPGLFFFRGRSRRSGSAPPYPACCRPREGQGAASWCQGRPRRCCHCPPSPPLRPSLAVHHLQSEKPENGTDGCRDVTPVDCRDVTPADCGDAVARDHQRLREALCPPQGQDPAGNSPPPRDPPLKQHSQLRLTCPRRCSVRLSIEGDGCRLCPPGWTRRGRKCYWVADGIGPWNESRKNCTSQDAELLMPEDCDELEFVKDIAKKPSKYFWIDISGPDRSQIRLSGSCLDQSGLPLGSSKGCRALKGNRILTETCGSMISWICQKAAVAL
ncbi:uncharacterized protein [Apteryx mantelli]|uniref:C-type lectin domain-containing protein n=1 Tax=Apteryx mantelli TaxID=2696672 RepID=A0ABM4FY92_9AVES